MALRHYAKRRGCALMAVQRAIASKRISDVAVRRDDRGRCVAIDATRADADWIANTDPVQAARAGHIITAQTSDARDAQARTPAAIAAAGAERDPRAGSLPLDAGSADIVDAPAAAGEPAGGFGGARAMREQYQAESARLDLLERLGALTPTANVQRAQREVARRMRDALLALPDRCAALLAAESDVARIHAILSNELRQALNGLAERLPAEQPA